MVLTSDKDGFFTYRCHLLCPSNRKIRCFSEVASTIELCSIQNQGLPQAKDSSNRSQRSPSCLTQRKEGFVHSSYHPNVEKSFLLTWPEFMSKSMCSVQAS